MKIIKNEHFNKVTASKGKYLRAVSDIYVAEREEDGQKVAAHYPHYSELLYLPFALTEKQIKEMYVEEKINE